MSSRGTIIALSGVDNAGKSTQRDLLLTALRAWGASPVRIWTRAGYTPGLEFVKNLSRVVLRRHKPARKGISRQSGRYPRRARNLRSPLKKHLWIWAAVLDLIWIYGVRVRVLRASGRTVVCDRYLADCLVDFRVNFPDDDVERWLLFRVLLRVAARPDAAFCLLVPADVSAQRAQQKNRYHWESPQDLDLRWAAYREVADMLGLEVLDGQRSKDEVSDAVLRSVKAVWHGPAVAQAHIRPMEQR